MNTALSSSRRAGFSLVEIAVVVAILAAAFIPLVALLPSGVSSFRSAMNVSICTQIAQRVLNDAAQANFDTLIDRQAFRTAKMRAGFTFRAPRVVKPSLRYFDDQGSEIVADDPTKLSAEEALRVIYQVNTRVMPQAPVPASEKATVFESESHLALVTVQVAFAPSSVALRFSPAEPDDVHSPDRNLIARRPGMEVFTYSSLIGRGL